MKKILFLISTLLITPVIAKEYGMAGCGLGAMLMGKSGNQILASTTNDTGTQTFGISSGTSNCVTATQQTAMIKNFIEANYQALITDMAKGQGDAVYTLSSFYGCNKSLFATEVQQNYSNVMVQEMDATKLMVNINNLIRKSDSLNSNCTSAI